MLKSYLKQDDETPPTPTQHYLVWIRLKRTISLIRLLQFVSDLKSTIRAPCMLYNIMYIQYIGTYLLCNFIFTIRWMWVFLFSNKESFGFSGYSWIKLLIYLYILYLYCVLKRLKPIFLYQKLLSTNFLTHKLKMIIKTSFSKSMVCTIYFWLRFIFVYQKSLKRTFKTFWIWVVCEFTKFIV